MIPTGLQQRLADVSVERGQETLQFGQILYLFFALGALLGLFADVDVGFASGADKGRFDRQVSVQGPVASARLAVAIKKVLNLQVMLAISLRE